MQFETREDGGGGGLIRCFNLIDELAVIARDADVFWRLEAREVNVMERREQG